MPAKKQPAALFELIVRDPKQSDPLSRTMKLSFTSREAMEDTAWVIRFAKEGSPYFGLEVEEDRTGIKLFGSGAEALETIQFWFRK